MVEIIEVKTRRQLKEFVLFQHRLYENSPYFVPDLISDVMDLFTPEKNPAYEYCDAKCFLAVRDGKTVGRVAGIISRRFNEMWNANNMRFSRIDFIDDMEVSGALLATIERWAQQQGLNKVHGPIGFCDLDEEGMLIEGFDQMSMFFTMYNYPYYIDHMVAHGYIKDSDWVEYRVKVPEQVDERLIRLSDAVQKRSKVRLFEPKNSRDIVRYLPDILKMYNKAYAPLYGFVPLTDRHLEKYYNQFKMLVNYDYIRLLFDKEDKIIGFGLGIPSLSETARKIKGRLFPFGWYHLLKTAHKSDCEVLDLYLVGVVPEMQAKGMTAVLMQSMISSAIKHGVRYAETGPELEDNEKVRALWKEFDVNQHKRRRCWLRMIDGSEPPPPEHKL
ncbi:hypothetical protein LJC55_00680 [Eubacteriales bacterium OttesenSCG-928-N14]|nr:hypothetical protein [Eubacteriales bacterium OttesenSCG-928-N14]